MAPIRLVASTDTVLDPLTNQDIMMQDATDQGTSVEGESDDKPSKRPFPILKLPAEIRVMIYVLLPTATRHHVIAKNPSLTLVSRVVTGAALLPTCRLINHEIKPILRQQLQEQKKHLNEELSIIAHPEALHSTALFQVLDAVLLRSYPLPTTRRFVPMLPSYPAASSFLRQAEAHIRRLAYVDPSKMPEICILVRLDKSLHWGTLNRCFDDFANYLQSRISAGGGGCDIRIRYRKDEEDEFDALYNDWRWVVDWKMHKVQGGYFEADHADALTTAVFSKRWVAREVSRWEDAA